MDSIVVLNWNTTDLLIGMLESAIKLSSQYKMRYVIVDNGSVSQEYDRLKNYIEEKHNSYTEKNMTSDFLKNQFEYKTKNYEIILRRLPKNIGFAAGNNVGLEILESFKDNRLVFFINSDIVIQEQDWDKKFEDIFRDMQVGVVGCAYHPLQWTKDGRFQIQPIVDKPVESESVQGAFFSILWNVLRDVKERDKSYFDENFKFAHYEETDLCFRIMEMGLKCFWIPCQHLHLHDKSSTKKNGYNLSEEIKNIQDFKANSERNRQLLYKKHLKFFRDR